MQRYISKQVTKVLNLLEQNGYQAYIVGGAVRDMLLGRIPQDYDLATNAKPGQVAELSKQQGWRVIDKLGQNFGVVNVIVDEAPIEIATFRDERYGLDSHRPEHVWFTDSIDEDLARRDFTINAMATNLSGVIVDPFGGQGDLDAKIIRTVGSPHRRFQEDALRMFRACRFAGQLGFDIEAGALTAFTVNLPRVSGLSVERVRKELEKMLIAKQCQIGLDYFVKTGLNHCSCRVKSNGQYSDVAILPELTHLVGLPQNPAYHKYDGWRHTLEAVKNVPPLLHLRWSALLHDVAKGLPGIRGGKDNQYTDYGHDVKSAELALKILTRFEMKPKLTKLIVWIIARHMQFYVYLNNSASSAVRWLRQEARSGNFRNQTELRQAFALLAELCSADIIAAGHSMAAAANAGDFGRKLCELINNIPVHTSDLMYSAETLAEALGSPRLLGRFLRVALQRVQDGSLDNCEDQILAAAYRWAARNK